MKFNNFITIPTFSALHRDNQTIEAIVRSSDIDFEEASQLNILSYSGKMRNNSGAGIAVFQQEIGVFKDFGATVNYAHQIQMGAKSSLTFGFNFFYSRRSLNSNNVITQAEDAVVSNFQDIPVINIQPAVTFSYNKFNIGVFFEDLAYFNLENTDIITQATDRTISGHVGYANRFEGLSGLLENTYIRVLGIGRTSQIDGFTFGGNVLVDLPKAVWLKAGYDSTTGFNAGFGVNINQKVSVGISYETNETLGVTNEFGISYTFGQKRNNTRNGNKKPNLDIDLPDYSKDPEETPKDDPDTEPSSVPNNVIEKYKDSSEDFKRVRDSLKIMNNKLDEILKSLKDRPKETVIIREPAPTPVNNYSNRNSNASWRKQYSNVGNGGGAGTMYYVALDQFSDVGKANALIAKYKKRDIKVKKVKDPNTNKYFVYEERFSKKDDAEELKKDINTGGGIDTDKANEDVQIKFEKKYSDPVYVVKVTLGSQGESYRKKKTRGRARVRNMNLAGVEPGYYLQVNAFGNVANADRFIGELRGDGFPADYFIHPDTGNRHVYLIKTEDRDEAIRLYNSNLDGSYYDPIGIINIQ